MSKPSRKRKNRRLRKGYSPSALTHKVPAPLRLRLPRVEISTGRRWFVIRTVPRMDQRAADELKSLGAEVYLPLLVEERIRRNRRVDCPQYPAAGYVFAGTTLAAEDVPSLGHVDGAVEVLSGPEGPLEVKAEALQVFADMLTRCNEEAREAKEVRLTRVRGLAALKLLVEAA